MSKKEIHNPTQRVLDVLKVLEQNKLPLNLSDISYETEIPKGTLSPILHTMSNNKFLIFDDIEKTYAIGPETYLVGKKFLDSMTDFDIIYKEMNDLVKKCGETCQLAVLEGNNALYIAKVDSPHHIRLVSEVGKTLPAYATSVGKALLSEHSLTQLKVIFPSKFKKFTENTLSSVQELYKQIADYSQKGLYYDYGEIIDNVDCISVPIKKNSRIEYAISVSIPSYRFTSDIIKLVEKELLETKKRIELILN